MTIWDCFMTHMRQYEMKLVRCFVCSLFRSFLPYSQIWRTDSVYSEIRGRNSSYAQIIFVPYCLTCLTDGMLRVQITISRDSSPLKVHTLLKQCFISCPFPLWGFLFLLKQGKIEALVSIKGRLVKYCAPLWAYSWEGWAVNWISQSPCGVPLHFLSLFLEFFKKATPATAQQHNLSL